jgi:hypothetical protein
MSEQIKVFGDKAKLIQIGDIFTPTIGSVEGRTVVTLVKNQAVKELLKKYDEGIISLDQIIKYLRDLTSLEPVES